MGSSPMLPLPFTCQPAATGPAAAGVIGSGERLPPCSRCCAPPSLPHWPADSQLSPVPRSHSRGSPRAEAERRRRRRRSRLAAAARAETAAQIASAEQVGLPHR